MFWLVRPTVRGAPQRLLLAAVAVALPVAILAATLLFVDTSLRSMTRVALQPVQVEMRALAASLDTDMRQVARRLGTVPDVERLDLFGSADVVVSVPGRPARIPARLFAVDQSYLKHHNWVHTTGDLRRGALLSATLASESTEAPTVSINPSQAARCKVTWLSHRAPSSSTTRHSSVASFPRCADHSVRVRVSPIQGCPTCRRRVTKHT